MMTLVQRPPLDDPAFHAAATEVDTELPKSKEILEGD
jgi:hypothetical protein